MKLKPQFTKPPNSRNHGTRSHSTTPASTLAVPRSLQSAIESVNHNNLNGALNSVKLEHKIPELSPDLVCSRALSLSLWIWAKHDSDFDDGRESEYQEKKDTFRGTSGGDLPSMDFSKLLRESCRCMLEDV
ncbi:hypothetical protein Droror1_Dr00011564 [Drosera rotundifolia]